MDYFQDFTFHWWEFGLLKVSVISLGILIGSYWPAVFSKRKVTPLLWVIFALPAVYLLIAALRQIG